MPKKGKAAHPATFTVVFWFFGLILLALTNVGDCFDTEEACAAGRRLANLRVIGAEFVIYVVLLVLLLRNRREV